MISYILKIRLSASPVSETRLTRLGIWVDGFDPNETAYEMCVEIYQDIFDIMPESPERVVPISHNYHRNILEKYSTDELLNGVKIESLMSVVNSISLDKELLFEEEVRVISNEILEKLKFSDSDYHFLDVVQREIMKLKEKFKIQPR